MDFFSNKNLKPSSSNDDSSTPPHPPLSFSGRRSNDKSKSPMEVKCSAGIGYDTKEFNKETEIEQQLLDKVNQKYSPPTDADDDDQLKAAMRKARLVVKVQSEAFMIDDGCQWRKYGKKMANGNPWPRVYYRCTMGSGCPVTKRVQRCAEDQTILITYEGSHNHELSPAAMALAQKAAAALKAAITSMGSALPNNVNDDNNSKVISSNIKMLQNFQNIRLGD